MKNFIKYVVMVVNPYMAIGAIVGVVGKATIGGPFISVVTGMVAGIVVHEVAKFIFMR